MRHGLASLAVLATTLAPITGAPAHVVLEQGQAEAGTPYKAVLRVGHGCGDSPVTELVVQIRWSGGRLDPAQYDDFVLLARLPDRPGPLYWKIAQICETGRSDWVEIPAAGQTLPDLKAPAALLELRPAAPAAAPAHPH